MYKIEDFMGKRVLKSSFVEDDDIVAFFTTRDLPLKAGEHEDLIEEVENNKKLICEGLEVQDENLFIPQQTHSDNVGIIKSLSDLHFENTDALITNLPNTIIALNFADCTPIILFDSEKKVIASAHAGWRGTVAQIGVKTVNKMIEEFGCNPENITALIGPAIGKCCFECGEDVLEKLRDSLDCKSGILAHKQEIKKAKKVGWASRLNIEDENFCSHLPTRKLFQQEIEKAFSGKYADLKLINKLQLLSIGLKKIDVCEYCTSCQSELFFSYRKEKGNTARHSAVVMIKYSSNQHK